MFNFGFWQWEVGSTFLPRLAMVCGRSGKPSLVIDTNFHLWMGNEQDEEMVVPCSELCGFNTGSFDFKIVRGRTDRVGVAWRLETDLDLVVFEKRPICLSQLLHKFASNNGLGDIQVLEHVLEPRLHAVPRFKNYSRCLWSDIFLVWFLCLWQWRSACVLICPIHSLEFPGHCREWSGSGSFSLPDEPTAILPDQCLQAKPFERGGKGSLNGSPVVGKMRPNPSFQDCEPALGGRVWNCHMSSSPVWAKQVVRVFLACYDRYSFKARSSCQWSRSFGWRVKSGFRPIPGWSCRLLEPTTFQIRFDMTTVPPQAWRISLWCAGSLLSISSHVFFCKTIRTQGANAHSSCVRCLIDGPVADRCCVFDC